MQQNVLRMNALESRKQLLIMESELNRNQLRDEMAALRAGLHTITHRATTAGAMASSAAKLTTTLAAIPRKQHTAGTKSGCLQTILYGTVLVSSVCLALIPHKS